MSNSEEIINFAEKVDPSLPKSYPFGYYQQFWISPMYYYNVLPRLQSCYLGEYAEKAYTVMANLEGWGILCKALEAGEFKVSEFEGLALLSTKDLTDNEITAGRNIVIDSEGYKPEAASHYKESIEQAKLILKEYEVCKDDKNRVGYSMLAIYLFRHLTRKSSSIPMERAWRLLCSTYSFELGIIAFFKRIYERKGQLVDKGKIEEIIKTDLEEWIEEKGVRDFGLEKLEQYYLKKEANSWNDVKSLIERIEAREDPKIWIDGIWLGYLVAKNYRRDIEQYGMSKEYESMGTDYYMFNPFSYLLKYLPWKDNLESLITKIVVALPEDQHEYSNKRELKGQKPKSICLPLDEVGKYQFEVSPENIYPFDGVVRFVEGTLALWESCNILDSSKGVLKPYE